MLDPQMKFGYINSKKFFIIFILFFSMFAYGFASEENVFENSLRNGKGEIRGFEQDDNLFFFKIVGKESQCKFLLKNVRIDKKTCKVFFPIKKYYHRKSVCFYEDSPNNHMFDGKTFYYQFDEYKIFHKKRGKFVYFDENYEAIKKCSL